MIRNTLLAIVLFAATPLGAQLTHRVSCWHEENGMTRIVFGYENTGAAVTIPIGIQNSVAPAPIDRDQPETFATGDVDNAFIVTVPVAGENDVTWTVNGLMVAFNRAFQPECSLCLCETGPEGPEGAAGPQGDAGSAGVAGPRGMEGPIGATGDQGPQGLPGPAGAQGATGPSGIKGPVGPSGAAGVAGATGPAGPEGMQGPEGSRGATGAAGEAGPAGPAGAKGIAGDSGPQGPRGAAGAAGIDGARGATGARGARGPNGEPGRKGRDGEAAIVRSASGANGVTITIDKDATLIVVGAVAVRGETGGTVQVVVDGRAVGVRSPVPRGAASVAISATAGVRRGVHEVEVVGSDGVTIESASLTVISTERSPGGRQRLVGR